MQSSYTYGSAFDPMSVIINPTDEKKEKGGIFLGNITAAGNKESLKKNKIRAVLTVASGTNLKYPKEDIDAHLIVEAEDYPHYDISKNFEQTFLFIDQWKEKTNILVHCFAGVSRSASVVIAYIMKKQDCSYQQAFEIVKKGRDSIFPNFGFIKQLKDYDQVVRLQKEKEKQQQQQLLQKQEKK